MAQMFNPCILKAEIGTCLEGVLGQPQLHRETHSQNKQTSKQNQIKKRKQTANYMLK